MSAFAANKTHNFTMDSVFPTQDNLGSTVLLTNKTTVSNKLLTLASPRPRRTWICRNLKVTLPSIGIVWYLPMCWLFHIYLIMICIRELDHTQNSHVNSVVQVLMGISIAAMGLFTAASLLKVVQSMGDLNNGWTYQKHPSIRQIVQAIRSQKYQLQGLAAFILVNSYLLLQSNQMAPLDVYKTLGNDTVQLEWNRPETNSSASEIVVMPLLSTKVLPFIAFCVHFAVPLVFYTMEETEPIWQKQHFWGFYYSVLLLFSVLKYLSSAVTYYVVSLNASHSPQIFIFHCVPTWLPPLYAVSVLSIFFYSLILKIYMEMRFKTPISGSPVSNLTLRRKVRIYPSPLGIILTKLLVIASEVPFLLHLIDFVLLDQNQFIVYLLSFNSGYCLLSFCGCLILIFRKRQQAKKCRCKQKQIDSGVCLAASFVYQSGPESKKKACEN